jgi:GcrA cell cycle regulator
MSGGDLWSKERTDLAIKLSKDGHSASWIAERIGGITRNSVIGRLFRLGHSCSSQGSRDPRKNGTPPRVPRGQTESPAPPGATGLSSFKRKRGRQESKGFRLGSVAPSKVAPYVERPSENDPPPEKRLTVLQLSGTTCKWPIGTPGEPGFGFCGKKIKANSKPPYCDEHACISVSEQWHLERRLGIAQ